MSNKKETEINYRTPAPQEIETPRMTPAITFDTIFGNRATIMLASIVEMIWHNTGYCEIFTPRGCFIVQMSREVFDDLNKMRSQP